MVNTLSWRYDSAPERHEPGRKGGAAGLVPSPYREAALLTRAGKLAIMQRGRGRSSRLPVLAEPAEVVVDALVAGANQWFRIAGSDYCRLPEEHPDDCRCAVRVLTHTAYRIRERRLGAFAGVQDGCFEARALSAADRPDKRYPVEIKARWVQDCA